MTDPEVIPVPDPTVLLLTVEEGARRLRIGRTTMYALIGSGAIETVPVGRLRRIPVEAIAEYVHRLRQAHRSATAA
ncbi:helix-turn-helix domain-containing protein [Embleya sp. NPDC127516]|uniref:helix-turn-helix domain-containing protein n=1 Tax=Embleya sp. NPDC127516 TaxID=3363990 RepID=UPI0037F7EB3B